MYYKNISLHLAYLQTDEKKNLQNCYFFKVRPLSHPLDSKIQSVLSFLRIYVYIIFIFDM